MTQRVRRYRRPVVPFRNSVLALAVAAALAIQADAGAVEIGHARMESAAGQPLQVVVPLRALSAEEAASLKVDIPDAGAWNQAGLTPPVSLDSLRVRVESGRDGSRRDLRVFSTQPPSQPAVDLLLELTTVAGKRQVQRSFVVPSVQAPGTPSPALLAEPQAGRRVQVRRGDTLFEIAQANRPDGTDVFQMLVALWRANPQAFIQSNMNLVKAGASLAIPDAATVRAIDPREARRIFREHDEAFARYRGRLGSAAAAAPAAAGGSPESGRIEAAPAARAPQPQGSQDRVRLSTDAAQQAEDERVAQQRALREKEASIAQLSSNIDELNRALSGGGAAGTGTAGAATGGTGGTGGDVAAPGQAGAVAPGTEAAGSAAGMAASGAAAAASAAGQGADPAQGAAGGSAAQGPAGPSDEGNAAGAQAASSQAATQADAGSVAGGDPSADQGKAYGASQAPVPGQAAAGQPSGQASSSGDGASGAGTPGPAASQAPAAGASQDAGKDAGQAGAGGASAAAGAASAGAGDAPVAPGLAAGGAGAQANGGLGADTTAAGSRPAGHAKAAGSGSAMDWIVDNLLGVVTAVLATLALIIAWVLRRAGAREEDYDDYDDDAPNVPDGGAAKAAFDQQLRSIDLDLDEPARDEPRR